MISGSLVQLKSGGPVMTVAWVDEGKAYCNWFDDKNELQGSQFVLPHLVLVNPND